MWTDEQAKIQRIRCLCAHPGIFHWTGQQVATAILNILDEEHEVHYELVGEVLDAPIPYGLGDDGELLP